MAGRVDSVSGHRMGICILGMSKPTFGAKKVDGFPADAGNDKEWIARSSAEGDSSQWLEGKRIDFDIDSDVMSCPLVLPDRVGYT